MPAKMPTVISVNSSKTLGPVKFMNAVNNGPTKPRADQSKGNFETYKALKIPYARIHDANWSSAYGAPHTVDITAIFPNFDADVNDPASYDFAMTDNYLQTIVDAGTEVFYRLGQSIEHGVKKYGIYPPKDNQKWAEICEHIIRHYTEGWANGFKYKIEYWEIWNEPDLGVPPEGGICDDPKTWGGDAQQFFELYAVAATHLKKCFPHLKIGGPSLAYNMRFGEKLLEYAKAKNAPCDFFSWHTYFVPPRHAAERCRQARETLDRLGFTKTESILNEWNYVKDWSPSWVYSLEVESGRFNLKGAAFIAAVMSVCQDAPLDMLMYYDARVSCAMNGMFEIISLEPQKGYYPFYAWSKLIDLGVQCEATVTMAEDYVKIDEDDLGDIYATAAVSKDGGAKGLFITRYNSDNNVTWKHSVKIYLGDGVDGKKLRCHLTDDYRTYTEVPLEIAEDGSVEIAMCPNSFAMIEW